jgi:hypothetical protein
MVSSPMSNRGATEVVSNVVVALRARSVSGHKWQRAETQNSDVGGLPVGLVRSPKVRGEARQQRCR